ncbi:MAG: DNA/RNA nuclease SfsA [Planctomycetota bacterium]
MRFPRPLLPGVLLRRYKRFLADVELASGEQVTAHTANPGRMTGLVEPGRAVWLSEHDDPRRKLRYTWELLRLEEGLVGINPARANGLVEEAVAAGAIPELAGYARQRREVAYGARGSRVDLLLEDDPDQPGPRPPCYVEVKNATLREGDGALFPDAPSARGRKHLLELQDEVAAGRRAVLVFLVQRPAPLWVGPAAAVDPAYAAALREALAAGVEALAYRVEVSLEELRVRERLPVRV